MTERSENLPAAPVSHSIQSLQFTKGKEAAQPASSRITARRLLALALLLMCATLAMLTSLLFLASRREPSQMVEKLTHMMAIVRTLPEHLSSQSLVLGGSAVVALLVAIAVAFFGMALLALSIVNALIRPQRDEPFIPLTPFVLDLPAEEVTFSSLNGNHLVRGIYIAKPDATTTVIISPGYRRGLTDVLGMCKHLWAAGHNVLAFEYYGHGSVIGVPITLGYREVNDFLGAVSYARQRAPEARIGALGYSMGGAVTIMGSAQTPEVLAIVADSAFASHWSPVEMAVRQALHLPANKFRRTMKVLRWVTDVVLGWRAGYHFHQVEPCREIARIAPRPLLLIHGLDDTIVSPSDSVCLYQAAGRPKALWHLSDTQHIKGYFTDSVKYTSRVIGFFDRYLKQSVLAIQESDVDQDKETTELPAEQEHRAEASSPVETVVEEQTPDPAEVLALSRFSPSVLQAAVPTNGALLTQQATVEQTLMRMVANILELPLEQIRATSDFFEYGGDSHTLDALLSAIACQWHVRLDANDIFDHSVIFHLAAIILHRQQQAEREEVRV